MNTIQQLLTDHIDIWIGAEAQKKSGRGRASANAATVYGINKLRELILELAMRGKLLPQDASDEPASVLLKRISVDKNRLISSGEIKKERQFPAVSPAEILHQIPSTWEWVRFGEIAQHNSGKTLDSSRNSGAPHDYITTSNLYWGRFELESVRQMLIRDDEFDKCTAKKGDLLICEGGEAGRAAVWFYEKEICFQNHIHRARFYEVDPYFAYRFFEKLNATGEINQHRKGVGISNMSGKALASIVFPLPPLAEQHRIVAKVDELMALCDQLEAQYSSAADAHERLVSHLLDTLTRSQSALDFSATWQLIAMHFDMLFTTEASIESLKISLLQLAVMGRLVPSEPSPVPLVESLERSQARSDNIGESTKAKRSLIRFSTDKDPFQLPGDWRWEKLGNLILDLRYGTSARCSYDPKNGVPVLRIPNIDGDVVSVEDMKYGPLTADEQEKLRLTIGDVLLIRSNGSASLVGKTALVTEAAQNCSFAGYLVRIRLRKQLIDPEYFQLVMKTPHVRKSIETPIRTTSGVKNINSTEISNLMFPLPPLAHQHAIVRRVRELVAVCVQLTQRVASAGRAQQAFADVAVEKALAETLI